MVTPTVTALQQQQSRTVPSPYQHLEDSTVIIEGSVTGGTVNSEKYNDQFYDFDEAASIAPSDVDIRKYYKGMYIKSFLLILTVTSHIYGQELTFRIYSLYLHDTISSSIITC